MKPKLRFQGFHDDWEEKKLGEISTVYSGGTPKSTVKEYYQGNIPFIRSGEIHSNMTELAITHEAIENSSAKWVNKGDLLYAMYGATAGDVSISKIKGVINQAILCINTNQNKKFIEQYLTLNKDKYLTMYLQGGQGNLSSQLIKNYNIFLPSILEQEKIGAFLSQLDDRIEKQEQKIALLKERKKGWMQKLFNQEIRFKDENGNDYPDWEEKKLGEISKPKQWPTIDSSKLVEKGFPVYGANGIIGYYTDYNHENSEVCITCRGATCGNVHFTQKKSYITCNAMVLESLKANLKYIYYYLSFRGMKDIITGSAQPQITGQLLKVVRVLIPSLLEQEKIANFLSTQDELIEKEEEKLNLLKEQKKGLLQKMFV